MKKSYIIIIALLLIVSVVAYFKVKNMQMDKQVIAKFNLAYEEYNDSELNGLDMTTVINKAVSNNEKYEIKKDDTGYYILDDEYSIEIYIIMSDDETPYKMERFNQVGLDSFTNYFGSVGFTCSEITYHEKSGRIATMTFKIQN